MATSIINGLDKTAYARQSNSGTYLDCEVIEGVLYYSLFGTPNTAENITYTLPRASKFEYAASVPQWGNTNNVMQVFVPAGSNTLTIRNQESGKNANTTGAFVIA